MALIAVLLSSALIPVSLWISAQRDQDWGPTLGPHVHGVSSLDGETLLLGHASAARSERPRQWHEISTLSGLDVTVAAHTADTTLIVTDGRLLPSPIGADELESARRPAPGHAATAVGASGSTVYLAAGEVIFRSLDGGATYTRRTPAGTDGLTGTISVDPQNPSRAAAIDQGGGAVITNDSGLTWSEVGPTGEETAIAIDPSAPRHLATLTTDRLYLSEDAGTSWQATVAPEALQAIGYAEDGRLLAATVVEDRAVTFEYVDDEWRAVV